MIREFLEDDDFVLLNAAKVSTGGPFTRVDPVNESCLSLLDLCIVSRDLFPYVESFTVDNDRKSTPCRAISKTKVKYSDHFSLIIKFVNLPLRNKRTVGEKKIVRWNTNRNGGWLKYKELTSGNSVLDSLAKVSNEDPKKMMKSFDGRKS